MRSMPSGASAAFCVCARGFAGWLRELSSSAWIGSRQDAGSAGFASLFAVSFADAVRSGASFDGQNGSQRFSSNGDLLDGGMPYGCSWFDGKSQVALLAPEFARWGIFLRFGERCLWGGCWFGLCRLWRKRWIYRRFLRRWSVGFDFGKMYCRYWRGIVFHAMVRRGRRVVSIFVAGRRRLSAGIQATPFSSATAPTVRSEKSNDIHDRRVFSFLIF